jgi:hypothetical protein
MKLKQVLFTVRREYYDAIVSGEKTEEIRAQKKRWLWLLDPSRAPKVAAFMCGRSPIHRRHITRIYLEEAETVLGRPVSSQGMVDLDLLPGVSQNSIIVELGEVVYLCQKCGEILEPDPEDSSEWYCPECNYGWRYPHGTV